METIKAAPPSTPTMRYPENRAAKNPAITSRHLTHGQQVKRAEEPNKPQLGVDDSGWVEVANIVIVTEVGVRFQ